MYFKYCPTIPPEFHDNEAYFHRAQKAKKYAAKEAIERHEFDEEIGGI